MCELVSLKPLKDGEIDLKNEKLDSNSAYWARNGVPGHRLVEIKSARTDVEQGRRHTSQGFLKKKSC